MVFKTLRAACWIGGALAVAATPREARAATLLEHAAVRGEAIDRAEVRSEGGGWRPVAWSDLAGTPVDPGRYEVRVRVDAAPGADALEIPVCAGRGAVALDGKTVHVQGAGPLVLPLTPGAHEARLVVTVSRYERRIACGEPVRLGGATMTTDDLGVLTFDSPHGARGGGHAVVYVPPGHDPRRAGPLLVGAHPWNGSIWTYAACAELLAEARRRGVVLLMPSGLGNSLYTADAEDEVLRAVAAASEVLAIDRAAISIWGASMGGAGATTIGLHHPDRFASVTSFFGDSKYDLSTYVHAILADEAAAHRVNALDVVDNARHVPVWLVHGEDDAVSPIRQSALLAAALAERGFPVRFDRVAGMGHAGALVAAFAARVVDTAAEARVPSVVDRVTYRSVRATDVGAYGVRITRTSARDDAFVDVERTADGIRVHAHGGVASIILTRGALGTSIDDPPPVRVDDGAPLAVSWEPPVP
jgi:pimeloyl-ACP methyl ester carboxylesterase